jgi:type VI secretion system protein VasJ
MRGKIAMPDIDYDQLLSDPRIEAGRAAAGASGGGEDLRGSAEFDALESEVRKMETAGPAAVNWKHVNQTTVALLRDKSKDLVLASRLAYGLQREEGYRGLAVGITILHGMVERHWETMFPPVSRERGRAGSFDWLAEKVAPFVEGNPPTSEQMVFALIAHDRLVEIDTMLGEKLTRFPAALGPLVRALRPHSREARQVLEAAARQAEAAAAPAPETPAQTDAADVAPQPEAPALSAAPVTSPAPAATVAAPPAPVPSAEVPSAPAPEMVLESDTQQAFRTVFSAALRLSGTARQQAPSDPRAYLAARFALWSPISVPPPAKAGKTALPAPTKQRLAEIQALRAAANHQGLLMTAENAFAASAFWLDAQYIACEAMTALGAEYDAARKAVTGALAALLARHPSLTTLAFADGTPFAEAETIAWIAREVQTGGGAAGDGDTTAADALKLAQSGQTVAGLKLLMERADSRRGERDRFVARLDIGEFCLRFDLLPPLVALLDSLAGIVEQQQINRWEPQLAARLAGLTWRLLTHKSALRVVKEADIAMRKTRILGQLAELDIVMAAELSRL